MTPQTPHPTAEDKARSLAHDALDATINEDPEALWATLRQLSADETSALLDVLVDLTKAVSAQVAVDQRNMLLQMFGALGPRPGQEK